jgi:hypothetical protein
VALWGPMEVTVSTSLELPEKQEQLAAIYAVLEHLPEANHNSLERLIFHLVKQVPLPSIRPSRTPGPQPVLGSQGVAKPTRLQGQLGSSVSSHSGLMCSVPSSL